MSLPDNYASLSLPDILLSHHPPSSPTPTPIIIITLHRPLHRNAFTDAMACSLVTAFDVLSLDPRVRCIVVTGHGSLFCAGADLQLGLSYTQDTPHTHRDGGGRVALAVHRCRKPVIAAMNGSAVGVGVTMTLPMAVRVVSREAKIGFVFARRGIVMEAASSYFLPRLIGFSKAMHLITTGDVYAATHPLLADLFTEIVSKEKVLGRALGIAESVAGNTSAVSWTLMRDLMWRGPGSVEGTHLLDSRVLLEVLGGRDQREGVESFLEKREPVFKGTMERDAPSVWPWWEPVDVRPFGRGEVVKTSKL
ncbi:enoyl-CoA hydratase/isomeras-like protein [Amylocarpus encephaloides]|uniref:Enoyl-CoA hydratase/isomeras-like protein n=1 Tax=Amylocarpus encephaloides TaxID=45428 RepID=A0A9P8C698_9HELO|nr:enoyl-CoA hydratase/isomeras-like protein [Amylocarpus encephaloides]